MHVVALMAVRVVCNRRQLHYRRRLDQIEFTTAQWVFPELMSSALHKVKKCACKHKQA